jgi:hypothetical protein
VVTERCHRWDFHPLENQLASLHRLFHPRLHAGLARRTYIRIALIDLCLSAGERFKFELRPVYVNNAVQVPNCVSDGLSPPFKPAFWLEWRDPCRQFKVYCTTTFSGMMWLVLPEAAVIVAV